MIFRFAGGWKTISHPLLYNIRKMKEVTRMTYMGLLSMA